ncbi:MAG: Fic family protein [Roseburia sp.]|nr:Fic family protein [Roseburia sp.]
MYANIVNYWKEHSKSTEDEYNRLLKDFWLTYTFNSNNIENGRLNYHVTREVFEGSEITVSGVHPRDVVEAQNSKFVRNKVVKNLLNKTTITPELIMSMHKMYMNGLYDDRRYSRGERPGTFKVNDYCVGLTGEGSLPDEVSKDISDLCSEVENINEDKILESAAFFHLMFESIHAFADGNGRVGRLMTNYMLMLHNHPPINIFSEDKETYYLALEVFDRTGKITGFVEFLREQCVKTWKSKVVKLTLADAISRMYN